MTDVAPGALRPAEEVPSAPALAPRGSDTPSASVVVPVYNSGQVLRELLARLEPVLAASFESFEVIFVNDGSRDDSWQVIEDLARSHPWVHGYDLMRNYGQHNALLCGIRAAQGALTITIDDDLQHRPEDIPQLLAALAPEVDVVYGTPERQRHGALRDMAAAAVKLALVPVLGSGTARMVSAFRVFRTELRSAFAGSRHSWVSIDVMLSWATSRFRSVRVPHVPRRHGKSAYTFAKLLLHAFNMLTGFSVLPLRLASLLAVLFMLSGLGILLFVVGRTLLQGSTVPGFPLLASLIAILSGVQLFSLGILGEYLARIHLRMMDAPPYAVRRTASAS